MKSLKTPTWPERCASGMLKMWLWLPANVTADISSALFKLHKNFLYNSFHQGFVDKGDPQLASRIREYTEGSFNTMRDTSLQALDLAQSLERQILVSGVDKLSPLVLHCLYRAAFWLSYLAATNREDRFVIGRSILDRVLKAISPRWKAAGMYKSSVFVHGSY